jgi:hypothetical protein
MQAVLSIDDLLESLIAANLGPISFTRLRAVNKRMERLLTGNEQLREKVALHYGGLSEYVFCGFFCVPLQPFRACMSSQNGRPYSCMRMSAITRLRMLERDGKLPPYRLRLRTYPRRMADARAKKRRTFGMPWSLAEYLARSRLDEVYRRKCVCVCLNE